LSPWFSICLKIHISRVYSYKLFVNAQHLRTKRMSMIIVRIPGASLSYLIQGRAGYALVNRRQRTTAGTLRWMSIFIRGFANHVHLTVSQARICQSQWLREVSHKLDALLYSREPWWGAERYLFAKETTC